MRRNWISISCEIKRLQLVMWITNSWDSCTPPCSKLSNSRPSQMVYNLWWNSANLFQWYRYVCNRRICRCSIALGQSSWYHAPMRCQSIRCFAKYSWIPPSAWTRRENQMNNLCRLHWGLQIHLQTPLLSVSLIWLVRYSSNALFTRLYQFITSAILLSSEWIFALHVANAFKIS